MYGHPLVSKWFYWRVAVGRACGRLSGRPTAILSKNAMIRARSLALEREPRGARDFVAQTHHLLAQPDVLDER